MSNEHVHICIEGLKLLVPGKHPLTSTCMYLVSYMYAMEWIVPRLDLIAKVWQAPKLILHTEYWRGGGGGGRSSDWGRGRDRG